MLSIHHPLLSRVTWAVDAFSEDSELPLRTARALRAFTSGMKVTIEPVFVVPPNELFLSAEMLIQPGPSPRQLAKERIDSLLRTVELPGLIAPTLLDQSETSVRRSAGLLVEYAKETQSDLLCTGTHARTGIDRVLLGSFAESLLFQADIPLLIVGPETHLDERIREILFPTDFSVSSREAFDEVVSMACELSARILLFHKAEAYAVYPVLVPEYPYRDLVMQTVRNSRAQAEEWAASAGAQGVETQIIIDETSAPVAPSIVELAKERKPDLIAMASQTGPVASVLLGSVTRKVTRTAPCPVWAIHPPKWTREKTKAA